MKHVDWNVEKNSWLKKERGVSFEDAISAIIEGHLLEVSPHPNPKYAHQQIFIVEMNKYIYVVPFVEDEEKIFLKTIIPSRKAKKKYLK